MLKGVHVTLMIGPVIPKPVGRTLIEALASLQVTHNAGQRGGFQLKFATGIESEITRDLLPGRFFDPPSRVIVTVTLRGAPAVLMDGVITRHDLQASNQPGQATLTVTGVDISQVMDLIDFSGLPLPMPPEARVAVSLAKYAVYGLIPVIVPTPLLFVPNPLEKVPQQQGTDYQYVTKLANDVGYVFFVEPGPRPLTNIAYWGPEIRVGPPQPSLSVNMDAATNVESLSFGFDGIAKSLYAMLVHLKSTKVPIPVPIPDVSPLSPPLGKSPVIPLSFKVINRDEPSGGDDSTAKLDVAEAAMRGLARAAQSSFVISGSGSLDVLRYGRVLEARRLVGVRGAGRSYDGLYFVRSVTSTLRRGEFKQSFSLSRNAHVPLSSRAPL
jgi:hypothetical protein